MGEAAGIVVTAAAAVVVEMGEAAEMVVAVAAAVVEG
jgi:hypothetical protein